MKRIVFVFLLILIPAVIFSWIEPVNVSNTPMHSTMGSMAIGQDNRIHTAWSEWEESDSDHDIYYAYSDDGGSLWSTPENVCDDPRVSAFPNVIVDSSNTVHIIWDDGYGNTPMLWTYQSGDTWSTPVNIAEGSPGGEYPTAILDRTNRIWAFWHEYSANGQIWYTMYDGNIWQTPQKVTNESVQCAFPDVVVDSANNIHLVWMKYGGYLTDFDIYYSKYNGVEWSAPEKVESLPGYSCDAKIEIDSEDRPWVIWQERYGGYLLYYTYRDSSGWLSPTLIADEDRFGHDFVIDEKNYLHMFYDTSDPDLYYSFFDGVFWSTPVSISDTLKSCKLRDLIIKDDCLQVIWNASLSTNPGNWVDIYYNRHNLTGIKEGRDKQFKTDHSTSLNFPNPFCSETKILFSLRKKSFVALTISDITGRVIKELNLGYKSRGSHTISISSEFLMKGGDAGNGVYFYRIEADRKVIATGKMVVLR